MTIPNLNWIANYIWGIADDVLRDVYVRGKYRDVILPMTVLRRLDAVLEPTKQAVLDMKAWLDEQGIVQQKGRRSAKRLAKRSTTPRSSPSMTSAPGLAASQLKADFETTSTASRQASRTSSRTSSSATRSRASPRPTPSAR